MEGGEDEDSILVILIKTKKWRKMHLKIISK
jgi:hypothetical protein